MIKKIKEFFKRNFSSFRYSMCYDDMEAKGVAAFGNCCGLSGGDFYTEGLNYDCVSCPYLVFKEDKK